MIANLPLLAAGQSPLSDLYTMVIKNHLGEVAAIIVSALISHGKLTAKDLAKKTQISLKKVKTSLVSLIQLRCVLFWKEGEKVDYCFCETGVMTMIHSGQIINHIKEEYGQDSAVLMQNLLQLGHVTAGELVRTLGSSDEQRYQMETALVRLYGDGWIRALQGHDFSPIEDLWNKIYQDTMKQTPRSASTSEVKRVAEVKEAARTRLANVIESVPSNLYLTTGGMKVLSSNIQISVNYSRFEKHVRSILFYSLCESRIGTLSAIIYMVALKLVEKNSPEVHPYLKQIDGMISDPESMNQLDTNLENKLVDTRAIVFKSHDVVKHLPKLIDLKNSILTHNFIKPQNSKKRVASFSELERQVKRVKREDGEYSDGDDDEIDNFSSGDDTNSLVNHHLRLLASSTSIPFVMELTPNTFTIPFVKLKELVKEYNYEEIIKKTVGQDVLRILRCIKDLKLADEKTIANTVLLKDKLVRNEVYKLIQLNVIEIQEIPRSNDRAASKTFFAFRYKKQNSYNFLEQSLLYNMANILHVIEDFKLEQKVLLEKCEREDVKGHESELLLENELRTLNNLKYREINNIGKLNRLLAMYDVFH